MKQLIYLLPLFLSTWGFSQTFLNRGDVMVLGVDNDNTACQPSNIPNHEKIKSIIYFVSFKDIATNTVIDFTDNGWERVYSGFFGTTEGVYRFKRVGGVIPAGTVVKLVFNQTFPLTQYNNPGWNVTNLNSNDNNFNLASNDQFFIMQGGTWSANSPHRGRYDNGRLLIGYNTTNMWNSTMNQPSGSTNQSNLPSELKCYHQTHTSNSSRRRYSGPVENISHGEWQVRIYNSSNWTVESSCSNFNNNFNLTSIPIKTSIDEQTLCVSDVASPLSVINESNVVNYQWYVNTTPSTIGATAVGTNSFQYTPPTTTVGTYYYYCVMKINLPLNGVSNTTDCEFISNFYKVNVTANPATSPIISL